MRQDTLIRFRQHTFAVPQHELQSATQEAKTLYNDLADAWYQQIHRNAPAQLELVKPVSMPSRFSRLMAAAHNVGPQAMVVALASISLFWEMLRKCDKDCTIAGILSERMALTIVFVLILGMAIRIYHRLRVYENRKVKKVRAAA